MLDKTALLCLLLGVTAAMAESSEYQKYEANKKSALTAVLLQSFCPGAGNAYAGQSRTKVIVYPVLVFSGMGIGVIGACAESPEIFFTGGGIMAVAYMVSMLDAVAGCEVYNKKLKEKYKLTITPNSLNLALDF